MRLADPSRSGNWSRYWASGALHSCVGSFAGNYDGEVSAFWNRVLTAEPGATRALDIACGNGPVTRLLYEASGFRLDIDAVDLADIDPTWHKHLTEDDGARVRFHSRVAAESLPFEDAGFDLVVSQFGIEYSDLSRALPEVRRVLKPGGQAAFVLHACGSLIVRRAEEELPQYEWLLGHRALWDLAERLCVPMALAATVEGRSRLANDTQAKADREAFNVHMQETSIRSREQPGGELLQDAQQGIAAAFRDCGLSADAEVGRKALHRLLGELDDGRLRQRELVACALSEEQVTAFATSLDATLESLGTLAFANGEPMGWAARFRASR